MGCKYIYFWCCFPTDLVRCLVSPSPGRVGLIPNPPPCADGGRWAVGVSSECYWGNSPSDPTRGSGVLFGGFQGTRKGSVKAVSPRRCLLCPPPSLAPPQRAIPSASLQCFPRPRERGPKDGTEDELAAILACIPNPVCNVLSAPSPPRLSRLSHPTSPSTPSASKRQEALPVGRRAPLSSADAIAAGRVQIQCREPRSVFLPLPTPVTAVGIEIPKVVRPLSRPELSEALRVCQ